MTDPRYTKLARLLVEYSTALKKGDRVLLDMIEVPDGFTVELIRAVRGVGATPLVEVRHGRVTREVLRQTNEKHSSLIRDLELYRMKRMQAYIAIRGSHNANESSDVPVPNERELNDVNNSNRATFDLSVDSVVIDSEIELDC